MTDPARWKIVGGVVPTALVAARVELHWAVQIVAAAADRCIAPRPDDSHTTMTWRPSLGALVGAPLPSGLAVGVQLERLAALVIHGDAVVEALPLAGTTLDDALRWTAEVLSEDEPAASTLVMRGYEMPPRAAGPFEAQPAAQVELARWYHDASLALATVAAGRPMTTPIRIWPHHFDVGAIVYLDEADEHARQIGLGMSPGDGSYAEPYFYVTPYPVPQRASLPALPPGGHWHTQGFTGAILPASALIHDTPSADGQLARTHEFLVTAIAGAAEVIAGAPRA